MQAATDHQSCADREIPEATGKPRAVVNRFPASPLASVSLPLSACILLWSATLVPAQTLLIEADTLVTISGESLTPGAVLVVDGKVKQVAASIQAESDVKRLKVPTLMPGLVNGFSQAGLAGGSAEMTREFTPHLAALDSIDWQSRAFDEMLAEGITSVHVTPGTDNVFAGLSCIVKTNAKATPTILNRKSGLLLVVASDPTSFNRSRSRPDSIYVRQPTNRMGVVWILRAQLQRVKANSAEAELPGDAQRLAAVRDALGGKTRIFGVSRADFDIQTLLNVGDEFGFSPVVIGGEEAYRMEETLAAREVPVILGQLSTNGIYGREGTELCWNNPGQLQAAGVKFCLSGSNLLEQARFAVRYGLDRTAALEAITSQAAGILSIDDRVGTIEPGKDADLLALSGDPLEFTSSIQWVMVDGDIQFQQQK